MAKPQDNSPRPLALVLPGDAWKPGDDDALTGVVREDLLEMLQFLRLRVEKPHKHGDAGKLVETHDGPVLVLFDDTPGVPMDAVEGACEVLEDSPTVAGPCADGGVYLLGLAGGLQGEVADRLIEAASRTLEDLVDALEQAGLESVALPPWFRLRSAKDLSFAQTLARLSTLSEEGDMDFLADRLKLWFSERTNA